jgi:hypothetical protein
MSSCPAWLFNSIIILKTSLLGEENKMSTRSVILKMYLDCINNYKDPSEWDKAYCFDTVTGYRILNLGRKIFRKL